MAMNQKNGGASLVKGRLQMEGSPVYQGFQDDLDPETINGDDVLPLRTNPDDWNTPELTSPLHGGEKPSTADSLAGSEFFIDQSMSKNVPECTSPSLEKPNTLSQIGQSPESSFGSPFQDATLFFADPQRKSSEDQGYQRPVKRKLDSSLNEDSVDPMTPLGSPTDKNPVFTHENQCITPSTPHDGSKTDEIQLTTPLDLFQNTIYNNGVENVFDATSNHVQQIEIPRQEPTSAADLFDTKEASKSISYLDNNRHQDPLGMDGSDQLVSPGVGVNYIESFQSHVQSPVRDDAGQLFSQGADTNVSESFQSQVDSSGMDDAGQLFSPSVDVNYTESFQSHAQSPVQDDAGQLFSQVVDVNYTESFQIHAQSPVRDDAAQLFSSDVDAIVSESFQSQVESSVIDDAGQLFSRAVDANNTESFQSHVQSPVRDDAGQLFSQVVDVNYTESFQSHTQSPVRDDAAQLFTSDVDANISESFQSLVESSVMDDAGQLFSPGFDANHTESFQSHAQSPVRDDAAHLFSPGVDANVSESCQNHVESSVMDDAGQLFSPAVDTNASELFQGQVESSVTGDEIELREEPLNVDPSPLATISLPLANDSAQQVPPLDMGAINSWMKSPNNTENDGGQLFGGSPIRSAVNLFGDASPGKDLASPGTPMASNLFGGDSPISRNELASPATPALDDKLFDGPDIPGPSLFDSEPNAKDLFSKSPTRMGSLPSNAFEEFPVAPTNYSDFQQQNQFGNYQGQGPEQKTYQDPGYYEATTTYSNQQNPPDYYEPTSYSQESYPYNSQGYYTDPNQVDDPRSPAMDSSFQMPDMSEKHAPYNPNSGLEQDPQYAEVSFGLQRPQVPDTVSPTRLLKGTLPGSFRSSFDLQSSSVPSNPLVGQSNVQRSDGRPPHCVISWGFGGQLVMMCPESMTRLGSFGGSTDNEVSTTSLRKGPVRVFPVAKLINAEEISIMDVVSFVEPLICRPPNDNLLHSTAAFIQSKIVESTDNIESKLLWQALLLLVEGRGEIDRSALGLLLRDYPSSPHVFSVPPSVSDGVTIAAMSDIEDLLSVGDREGAVVRAVESNMWAQALIISNYVSIAAYRRVISRFVEYSMHDESSSKLLFKLFAGEGVDSLYDMNGEQRTVSQSCVNEWKRSLSSILVNRTPGDTDALATLGDELVISGNVTAGHVCYLSAGVTLNSTSGSRMVLVGGDHKSGQTNFINPGTIQRTELYAFAQTLRNPSYRLDSFQSYRLVYAMWLADLGLHQAAYSWVRTIQEALKSGSPSSGRSRISHASPGSKSGPFPQAFQREMKIFTDRLMFCQKGRELGLNVPHQPEAQTGWIPKLRNPLSLFGSDRRLAKQEKGDPADNHHVQKKLDFSEPPPISNPEPPPPVQNPQTVPSTNTSSNAQISYPETKVREKGASKVEENRKPVAKGGSWLNLGKFKEKLIQSLVPLDSEGTIAHTGKEMEAYYDEKLKRWVFPGDEDTGGPVGPPPPPPMKMETTQQPTEQPTGAIAAMMKPPQFRANANFKKGASRSRYVDTFGKTPPVTNNDRPPMQPPKHNFNVFTPPVQERSEEKPTDANPGN